MDIRITMTKEAPRITLDENPSTGGANLTISVWLTETERESLIDRVVAGETVLHNRKKTVKALQLTNPCASTEETRDAGTVSIVMGGNGLGGPT